MAITAEQRLSVLEQELRDLKSTYSIAGGLAKMFVTTSQEFPVQGQDTNYAYYVRIKFTPTYGLGKNNIIDLFPVAKFNSEDSADEWVPVFSIEPQDGSGEIVLSIWGNWYTPYNPTIRVIAAGTSPGTFERIA